MGRHPSRFGMDFPPATAVNVFFLFFSPPLRSPVVPADINLNSPNRGMVSEPADSLSDVPVGGAMGNAANPAPPPGLTEEEAEELRVELAKVSVLHSNCISKILFKLQGFF